MKRHFYITDNLDDLELVEQELESSGVETPQIHILSENDADVENHHLHEVEAVLKKDVVHSMEIGAVTGIVAAIIVLLVAYLAGWTESAAGWVPFIFLAVVVLGFCTWEGGLFGIQEPHYQFKRFQKALHEGKHVLFVDVAPNQENTLCQVVSRHPKLQIAGIGEATPSMVVEAQKKWRSFIKAMP
ncbi:NAD/FAD-utilizing enzyme [Dasania sp. GY-MA-18]|uniref:NAD/FAD-utilizing enzyme n=1 Tax=Dasania phycosphaerae TaxID=2950436 RepID=A0A9J6RQD3_9GAMM|nr:MULTISPECIES: NAD/FAD-utilizing enzyme [Dasania]MCR8923942.1 NAD/FAD-utilizing enzyme [Dasania sp. GY-MA-18]MCZ0866376.1 NAD/FAD-utilizing enzyme [Dasania phycosphaerae]MCZ0870100.1 NAD/FAD-utilizing enzyme [Dasania phycosphaerae]